MKNIIGIEKMGYVFKGESYRNLDCIKFIDKLSADREIIIMGEPLLVKEYNVKENKESLERYIEDAITKDFSLGDDLLFHYEFLKVNNKVYIYSIKKGIAVEKVVIGARSISVTPIQFKVKEYISKKMRSCRNYIAIAKIRDLYYLINVEQGIIINGFVNEEFENIIKELQKYEYCSKEVIIDSNITMVGKSIIQSINEIMYLKIGEVINGKLFEKQKFYTKKLY
ncbi:MAG: hypothetical protein ACRDA5_02825 [Clostridium sp.]